MKVTLVAQTQVTADALDVMSLAARGCSTPRHGDFLVELAGRACYRSFDRPNPNTRSNRAYIQSTAVDKNHGSILEHSTATFYLEHVSRSLLAELTRHRHLSFSVLSQRYVDSATVGYVEPPAITEAGDVARNIVANAVDRAQADYESLVEILTDKGLPRKRAREAARCVLPNATATSIVVSGNYRAWRHVIELRASPAADREIQELARHLLRHLLVIAPSSFADMAEMADDGT